MRIIIDYPRKDTTKDAGRAVDILRNNGLNPTGYSNHLSLGGRIIGYIFHFREEAILPKKSELEKMLEGIGFSSVKVLNGKIK